MQQGLVSIGAGVAAIVLGVGVSWLVSSMSGDGTVTVAVGAIVVGGFMILLGIVQFLGGAVNAASSGGRARAGGGRTVSVELPPSLQALIRAMICVAMADDDFDPKECVAICLIVHKVTDAVIKPETVEQLAQIESQEQRMDWLRNNAHRIEEGAKGAIQAAMMIVAHSDDGVSKVEMTTIGGIVQAIGVPPAEAATFMAKVAADSAGAPAPA